MTKPQPQQPQLTSVKTLSPEERLGRLLVKAEVIKPDQMTEALRIYKQHTDKPFNQILVDKGWCSEWAIARALAKGLQKQFVSLKKNIISQKVVQLVPQEVALKYHVLPLFVQNKTLYVVMENPLDSDAVREIRKGTKLQVITMVGEATELREAIRKHYSVDEYVGTLLKNVQEKPEVQVEPPAAPAAPAASQPSAPPPEPAKGDHPPVKDQEKEAQIVNLANLIFSEGIKTRASDIHIDPSEQDVKVRYRIDGLLSRGIKLPKEIYGSLTSRIKVLAGLDIADRQNPQDGRIRLSYAQRNVDLRVSTIPASGGEKIVIRILDSTSRVYDLTRLGLSADHLSIAQNFGQQAEGLILVVGPTGSGKTTTVYALLNALKDGDRHIVTLEDPIEYQLEGITQLQINPKAGLTFASGLKSVLRQDPNVILLGEIRDADSASVAFQAAETGHLVLSTLNTTNAAAAMTRLLTSGISSDVLASHLLVVIAQRLVRRICPRCITEYTPTKQELQSLGIQGVQSDFVFHRGQGCKACRNSGYYGQVGIFEMLILTSVLREAIEKRASKHEIQRLAVEGGMKTIRESGIEKIFQGLTTLEEVARVYPLDHDALVRPTPAAPVAPLKQQAAPVEIRSAEPIAPPSPAPRLPTPCGQCGTPLEPNWMICPVCGWIKTNATPRKTTGTPPQLVRPAPVLSEQRPQSAVFITAAEETPVELQDNAQVDVPKMKERIVLAEDDPNTRMMVKFFLQQHDYEVILATDGEEALEKIHAERPDLVILDVNMPKKDGFEVCKDMRTHMDTMFTPVIMLTAQSSIEYKLQGLSLGADDYITKPFHPAELAARIEVILRRSYLHEVVNVK